MQKCVMIKIKNIINNYMVTDILENLPDDILKIIFDKINPVKLIFINKFHYSKFNYLIESSFFKGRIQRYHSYIRDIIRHDSVFIFKHILEKNFNKWLETTNFKYKNTIYLNYVNYLIEISTNYKSSKCNHLLKDFLLLTGLYKISLKNNKIKYNKWMN